MPQHNISLESPWSRIKLVPPAVTDDEACAVCRTHPITRRYLQFLPEHMTAEEAGIRRATRAEDSHILDFNIHYLKHDETTQFAGVTGFFNLDEGNLSCEVGLLVAPDLHGKGLATEALYLVLQYIFEERKLHRATFETGADNVGMRGWLEKVAGARLESDRKECWKKPDGTFTDVKGYAILESEWKGRVKNRLINRMGGLPL